MQKDVPGLIEPATGAATASPNLPHRLLSLPRLGICIPTGRHTLLTSGCADGVSESRETEIRTQRCRPNERQREAERKAHRKLGVHECGCPAKAANLGNQKTAKREFHNFEYILYLVHCIMEVYGRYMLWTVCVVWRLHGLFTLSC